MTLLSSRIATLAPFTRSIAIAALMGTTILASPMTAARAEFHHHHGHPAGAGRCP